MRIHTVFNTTCELIIIDKNVKYKFFINFIQILHLSKDVSCMKWDQVRQVRHGISTALSVDDMFVECFKIGPVCVEMTSFASLYYFVHRESM